MTCLPLSKLKVQRLHCVYITFVLATNIMLEAIVYKQMSWPEFTADQDMYTTDKTAVFCRLLPSVTLAHRVKWCTWWKCHIERITVLLCSNSTGNDNLNVLVTGKYKSPVFFKIYITSPVITITGNCMNLKSWRSVTVELFTLTSWLVIISSNYKTNIP